MTTNLKSIPIAKRIVTNRPMASSKPKRFHRYVGRVFRLTKKRMQAFESLQSLNARTRKKVRRQLRSHLIQSIALEERSFTSLEPVVWVIWCLFLGLALGAPVLANLQFRASYSIWAWLALYFVYWLALSGILLFAFWPVGIGFNHVTKNLKKRLALLFRACIWITFVTVLDIMLLIRLQPQIRARQVNGFDHAITAALFTYLIIFIGIILILLVTWIVLYAGRRQANARYPDTVVIVGLFNILYMAEKQPGRWTDLDFKRDVMRRLERIALCIEHDLPRRLRSGDDGTDGWLDKTSLNMATALREKKKLLLTPGLDARERLLESLRNCFFSAVTNNWDGLEKVEPGQVLRKQWHLQVLDYLQTFVRGAMPLLILWIVQQTNLALKGTAADTAMLAVLGWLGLTLLIKFDPLSKDKLDALKQVKDLLKA